MGKQTLREKMKDALGRLAWRVFIWAHWNDDERAYHDARDLLIELKDKKKI